MPTKIEWGISQDRLQEIKDYWCRDEDNYSLAGRDQRDICELVAAVEEAWADIRTQNVDLGKIIEDTTVELEASQQQLAAIEHLATSPTDRWDELEEWLDKTGYINEGFLLRCNRERNILRAKLAEARLENTKLGSKLETAKTHRKISEAEVKRLKDQLADCYDEHPYIVGG